MKWSGMGGLQAILVVCAILKVISQVYHCDCCSQIRCIKYEHVRSSWSSSFATELEAPTTTLLHLTATCSVENTNKHSLLSLLQKILETDTLGLSSSSRASQFHLSCFPARQPLGGNTHPSNSNFKQDPPRTFSNVDSYIPYPNSKTSNPPPKCQQQTNTKTS